MRFCGRDISKNLWLKIRPCVLALIALSAVILFTVAGASKRMARASGSEAAAPAMKRSASVVLRKESGSKHLETELITINPTGFEPKEITRPKGEFILAVDNRSGLGEVFLQLERALPGDHLKDVRVSRKQLDWRERVDLDPGRYLLTEANHPGWACSITITAN